jgi:hypothetical protein
MTGTPLSFASRYHRSIWFSAWRLVLRSMMVSTTIYHVDHDFERTVRPGEKGGILAAPIFNLIGAPLRGRKSPAKLAFRPAGRGARPSFRFRRPPSLAGLDLPEQLANPLHCASLNPRRQLEQRVVVGASPLATLAMTLMRD